MNINNNKNAFHKYIEINLLRKCKFILINHVMNFINKKIREVYNDNIGHGISIIKLFRINRSIIQNDRCDFNRKLMGMILSNIFSENITNRYHHMYPKVKNKIVIEELLNEKDDDKRNYFKNLFNLTFLIN